MIPSSPRVSECFICVDRQRGNIPKTVLVKAIRQRETHSGKSSFVCVSHISECDGLCHCTPWKLSQVPGDEEQAEAVKTLEDVS